MAGRLSKPEAEKLKADTNEALSYMKESSLSNTLKSTLEQVLLERPKNATDIIETYFTMGDQKNKIKTRNRKLVYEAATMKIKLFDNLDGTTGGEHEEDYEIPVPNISLLSFFFEQAGIGLGQEESMTILLALKQLAVKEEVDTIRFWGKIFGINANYLIAEVEFREGEGEEESNQLETMVTNVDEGITGEPEEYDNLPKSTWKPPPDIPAEVHHTGANKKVYFVCNEPGEEWVRLPHATPVEIVASRQISKLLSGNLGAEITSYPQFPGKEINYLRALIGRISATTQISPAGYFMFDGDEEDEEESNDKYFKNPEFAGLHFNELLDTTMCNWVHNNQYILPQGRCTWYNPNSKPEGDYDDEEDIEEIQISDVKPESGPQLLTSLAHDGDIGLIAPWSVYCASRVLPRYSIAVARSNLWPGAYAFAKGKVFENVYIGWGQKYQTNWFSPLIPAEMFTEYEYRDDIEEQEEPTLQMETKCDIMHEEVDKITHEIHHMTDDTDDE